MATPYALETEAQEYYAGTGGSALRLSVVMGLAANEVQRLAPTPVLEEGETLPADYTTSARNAELLVGAYLWDTGGYINSEGIGKISTSYKGIKDIEDIVLGAMGDYVASEDDGIAYIGRSPV